jgi:hypothetical protein
MFATKRLPKLGTKAIGGTTASDGRETLERANLQNWFAFVVILLLSMLVFMLAGRLSVGEPVRQANLSSDLRV